GGQPEVPGDHVPGDRAEHAGGDHRQPVQPGGRGDDLADGLGDLDAEQRADEVHDRRHQQRRPRRQRPGGHRRRDGVGGVVEPVGVVEDQGDDHDHDEDGGLRVLPQAQRPGEHHGEDAEQQHRPEPDGPAADLLPERRVGPGRLLLGQDGPGGSALGGIGGGPGLRLVVPEAHDSLTAIVSTVLATCSKASAAPSSRSMTCFSFSTVSVSYSPLNSWASSLRYTWSPWFSSRLISIQYSLSSFMERSRGIASAVSSAARSSTSTMATTPLGNSSILYRTTRSA